MTKRTTADLVQAASTSWDSLNQVVMNTEDEEFLNVLLKEELKFKKRKQYVLRIHSRINKLRADRERTELLEKIK